MTGKVLSTESFEDLIPLLRGLGYTVVAPTRREQTIAYAEIDAADDLPLGWTDRQEAGTYRTERRSDNAYFGYNVGPRTLKQWFFPPRQTLLTITSAVSGLSFAPEPISEQRYAFIGVRACDLAAARIQDEVFANAPSSDPHYVTTRTHAFTVAVNCGEAGGTCFCTSMGTGPQCSDGYDLVVTEVIEAKRHEFIVEAGTATGETVLSRLTGRSSTPADTADVDRIVAGAAADMGRTMPANETHDLLTANLEHQIWQSIGDRCLSCANCTLVCPTCFCSTVTDVTDLEGTARRERSWDSCFGLEFTNLHNHPVRSSPASRYRQWMTHKLAYWYDQFDSSGCVGCGRCITWCPVGIDITAEIAELQKKAEVST